MGNLNLTEARKARNDEFYSIPRYRKGSSGLSGT